jgi:hypothetical protein
MMTVLDLSLYPAPRRAALVAGVGLLLMAVLAGLANFGVLDQLDGGVDASRTTSNITAAFGKFRLAITGLFLVAILDVIIAWALWAFFDRVHHIVAVLAACCRGSYAVIFVVAISRLVIAAQLLSETQSQGTTDRGLQHEVAANVQQFTDIWSLGLGLFGVSLLLIGWLAFVSSFVPRFVGVLVAIAGSGYLIDSTGDLLLPPHDFTLTTFTFVGEVALMVWLLIFAVRVPATAIRSSDVGSRS